MTAPSATSHSCHVVVAELVSATVGLDKQFAMQVTGLKQACACHALPGETVSECMIACFKCNAWNAMNAALLHGMHWYHACACCHCTVTHFAHVQTQLQQLGQP